MREVMVEWLRKICKACINVARVPEGPKKTYTIPLRKIYKRKGKRVEMTGLLSIPGKVCGRVIIESTEN